jgi:hypothetical protein
MARLATAAPVIGRVASANSTTEGEGQSASGTLPTSATDRVRNTGLAVFKATAVTTYSFWQTLGFTLGRSYWCRCAFQFDVVPSTAADLVAFNNGTANAVIARLNTSGQVVIVDNAAATVAGGAGSAVSADTWFVVEIRVKLDASPTTSNGEIEFWLNGTQIANLTGQNCGTANWTQIRAGWIVGGTGLTALWWTDVGINDDQGANQNGRPGHQGIVRHLLPISDNAAGNWTDGVGGTTNLYDALNNVPPVGVVDTAASATSQIENPISGTSSYEANCATYDSVVPSDHDIVLISPVARIATSSLTGTNTGTMRIANNPDQGADSTVDFEGPSPFTAAGTEPTGWHTYKGTYTYSPSVTRSSGPRIRITKTTASTRIHQVDYAAVLVEHKPQVANEETGASTAKGSITAASVFEANPFGTQISSAKLFGTKIVEAGGKSGSQKSPVMLFGSKAVEHVKTGAFIVGASLSGIRSNGGTIPWWHGRGNP